MLYGNPMIATPVSKSPVYEVCEIKRECKLVGFYLFQEIEEKLYYKLIKLK